MRFRIEQRFTAALPEVEAALCDPGFLGSMAKLPKLGGAELLEQREEGGLLHQRVRYRFEGELNAAARAAIDPRKLTWVEHATIDRDAHRTTWRIVPDHYADRIAAEGLFALSSLGSGGTARVAEGDLRVRMPLVGRKVEQAIISGLREHAEAEAEALEDWLKSAT